MTEAIRKQDELAKNRVSYPIRKSYYLRGDWYYSNYFSEIENRYIEEKLFEQNDDTKRIIKNKINKYENSVVKTISHKRQNPEYYIPTFKEANLTHRFLYLDFISSHPFDPYTNWFGCSRAFYKGHTPDLVFKRGNKKIILSIQGMQMKLPMIEYFENREQYLGAFELMKQRAAKYIGFFIDEKPIYQSWGGDLPSQEFINDFTMIE